MRRQDLIEALGAAGRAHHEYEAVALGGHRHELWSGFYAAYLLGRLGELLPPSALAAALESADGPVWSEAAADTVLAAMGS